MYCQVVYICGLIPARIRQALAELPETLDETYQRSLREINKAEWEFAHRMFQFVAVASRPLRVEELADLLAFDFEAGQVPKFHEGWRLEDPVDAVLSTCSTLLAVVDGGYYSGIQDGFLFGRVIQFSHFSVKEFLTSARLAEASDIIARRHHISISPAHTLAARACLGILLHLDKDVITIDSLKKWPLAGYAAKHWADHTRMEDVWQSVEDGMKQLLDPSKPHLSVCIWIHDPDFWSEHGSRRPERPLPLSKTLLHYAALWGLFPLVESLVTEHPRDVRSRHSFDDATPLHLAVRMGHVKVSRFLLEHDADVTAQDKYGGTPLHLTMQRGQAEIPGMLIECGADVTAQTKNGLTPLHLALSEGQMEIADMLIERGADVTAQDERGWAPIHQALIRGQVEVAEMLIERSADVSAQTKDGLTPLHLALKTGQVEVAKILIKHGADVTAQTKNGLTPLHLALSEGQMEIADMLIERGADVTAHDERGWAQLHLASLRGQVEVAGMLIKHGAGVTAKNEDGSTPLHLASQMGEVEVAGTLIEHGADVTAKDKDGSTPLHLASQVEVVDILIEHGADVTTQDKNGLAPLLHLASYRPSPSSPHRYAEVVRILLEHGADVTIQNKDGQTPLDLASSDQGFEEVVHVLLQHGAKSDRGTQEQESNPILGGMNKGT